MTIPPLFQARTWSWTSRSASGRSPVRRRGSGITTASWPSTSPWCSFRMVWKCQRSEFQIWGVKSGCDRMSALRDQPPQKRGLEPPQLQGFFWQVEIVTHLYSENLCPAPAPPWNHVWGASLPIVNGGVRGSGNVCGKLSWFIFGLSRENESRIE